MAPRAEPLPPLQGDREVIKVNKLTSIKTQLPYEYYSIPYCRPEVIKSSAENLGEVLRGDRIENSLYEVRLARHLRAAQRRAGAGAGQRCMAMRAPAGTGGCMCVAPAPAQTLELRRGTHSRCGCRSPG